MITVNREIFIEAPIENVIAVMLNLNEYHRLVPNVKKVEVLEHCLENQRIAARFHTQSSLMPNTMVSEQEITYCFDKKEISFQQTEGAMEIFRGKRIFVQKDEGVLFKSEVQFKFSSGLMAKVLNSALEKVITSNVENLLSSVKFEAESNIQPVTMADLERLALS